MVKNIIIFFAVLSVIVIVFIIGKEIHKKFANIDYEINMANVVEKPYRCLVCFIGQTRAAELTWTRFRKHVLDVINPLGVTDIALSISKDKNNVNILYENAKYIWEFDEPSDIGVCFEYAANNYYNIFDQSWRDILKIGGMWLGGISDPIFVHDTRSSIMTFYRWYLFYNMMKENIIDNYDWFIITRSDNYYIKDHLSLSYIDSKYGNKILIPKGEDYGGICDRHIICHSSYVKDVIDLMSPIMKKTGQLIQIMKNRIDWNNESYQKLIFDIRGINKRVIRIPRVMFLVRAVGGVTNHSVGEYNNRYKLMVKYPSELKEAEQTLTIF